MRVYNNKRNIVIYLLGYEIILNKFWKRTS